VGNFKVQRAKFKEYKLNISECIAEGDSNFELCSLLFELLFPEHYNLAPLNYNAPEIIASTTPGSNNVEVSPKLPNSPSATFRKMRRMILPERVLGNPVTN